jgi:hypothetical protein
LGNAHTLLKDLGRVLNLSTTSTGEITGKERLKLDQKWKLFSSYYSLVNKICRKSKALAKWNTHRYLSYIPK